MKSNAHFNVLARAIKAAPKRALAGLLGTSSFGRRTDHRTRDAHGVSLGRHRTHDEMLTYDSAPGGTFDGAGNNLGVRMGQSYRSHDGKTYDSTGAFMVGELERLDQKLHAPLTSVSFGRDIDMRGDVTIGDEVTSFTVSTFASPGSLGTGNGVGNGKAWIGRSTTQITSVSVDIAKKTFPLTPWSIEIKYTVLELEASLRAGRPIDKQKYDALVRKHQMDIDEQVYIGDLSLGFTGMLNNSLVTEVAPFPNGAAGFPNWSRKTAQEILADINFALVTVWMNSAFAVTPNKILIPPAQYGYLATTLVSTAGNTSILSYILDNNLLAKNGSERKLEIFPLKWCIGAGVGGTLGVPGTVDRMMVYTQDEEYIRYSMTLLQKTPLQYDGIHQKMSYYCKLGVVEVVFPETVGFFDLL